MSTTTPHTQTAYKDTPIGKIPADWEVKRLGEICSHFKSGFGITSKYISDSGIYPVYGGNGLRGFTSTFTHSGKYVLIGRQGALCGNIQIVEGDLYISEHAIAVQVNENCDLEFLGYKLNYMNLNRLSESSAQPGLSVEKLVRIKIPLPPLPEQKRIAEVLSTWDQAIQLTEQLIRQKEQRKKWLMQNLLTGKMRLKGFSGEWKEMKIGDTGIIPQKTAITKIENHKLLTVRLHTKGIEFNERDKPILSKTGRPYYERYKGEILIGRQNIHNGGIGLITEEFDGHICSNAITSFIVTRNCTTEYLLYYLQYPRYYQMIENYMGGTGQKELSEKQFLEIPIRLPNTIEEQTAIAEVLQTADKEIELLKAKAEKLREQKKGLMQVLLTGRVRLL